MDLTSRLDMPTSMPSIVGDGVSTPLILRWEPPPPAEILGTVSGYCVEMCAQDAAAAAKRLPLDWRTLVVEYVTANSSEHPYSTAIFLSVRSLLVSGSTRNKAPKLALPSAALETGILYHFRVAAISSGVAIGEDPRGAFSPPSFPFALQKQQTSAGQQQHQQPPAAAAKGSSSRQQAAMSLGSARESLRAWSRAFESRAGHPPTDDDKAASSEYRRLARKYKSAKGASSRGGGTSGDDEDGRHKRSHRDRPKSNGHHHHHRPRRREGGGEGEGEGEGGGGDGGGGGGSGRGRRHGNRKHSTELSNSEREPATARRADTATDAAADAPPMDAAEAALEMARLDVLLEQWEHDFGVRQGRSATAADRAGSRFYSNVFHKRLEAASIAERGSGAGASGPTGARPRHASAAAAVDLALGGGAGSSSISSGGGGGGGGGDASLAAANESLCTYASLIASASHADKDGGAGASGDLDGAIDGISEMQLAQAVRAFRMHDTDGNGTLQYAEFAAAVREMLAGDANVPPIDQMHLRAAFHRLDADHSRAIDFQEYMSIVSAAPGQRRLDALKSLLSDLDTEGLSAADIERATAAFRRHDHDRRGALSPRSFSLVVQKLALADGHTYTEEELSGLLRRADLDADGDVDFHELLQLLARQKRVLKAKQLVEQRTQQKRSAQEDAEARREQAREEQRRAEQAAEEARRQADEAERRQAEAKARAAEFEAQIAAGRRVQESAAQRVQGRSLAYEAMLRENLEVDGALRQLPHVPTAAVDASVALFAKFDTRRAGWLGFEEFNTAMQAYAKVTKQTMSAAKLRRHFNAADSTQSGALSLGDFLRYAGLDGKMQLHSGALAQAAGVGSGGRSGGRSGAANAAPFFNAQADAQLALAMDEYSANLREELEASGVLIELPHVSHADAEACIAFYKAFDEDEDGQLTPSEFVAALKAYGRATGNPDAYKRRLLLEAFDSADVSADAQLELAEFLRFVGKNGRLNMDMKAMRRAALDWDHLKSFHVKDGSKLFDGGGGDSGGGGSTNIVHVLNERARAATANKGRPPRPSTEAFDEDEFQLYRAGDGAQNGRAAATAATAATTAASSASSTAVDKGSTVLKAAAAGLNMFTAFAGGGGGEGIRGMARNVLTSGETIGLGGMPGARPPPPPAPPPEDGLRVVRGWKVTDATDEARAAQKRSMAGHVDRPRPGAAAPPPLAQKKAPAVNAFLEREKEKMRDKHADQGGPAAMWRQRDDGKGYGSTAALNVRDKIGTKNFEKVLTFFGT